MKRKIFRSLCIGFISICLVAGLLGKMARAAEPERKAQAYEQEYYCEGGMCYYVGRQYTSIYDMMRGEYYPEMTVQYAVPNFGYNMFNPSSEYYASGSAIGGLFSGPMLRVPTSPSSWYLGTAGAPSYETYSSSSLFSGSTNYMSLYQGLGFGGAGFMLGPFRNLGLGGYSGTSSYGYGYPYGGGYGYPYGGYSGYGVGSYPSTYPQRIY